MATSDVSCLVQRLCCGMSKADSTLLLFKSCDLMTSDDHRWANQISMISFSNVITDPYVSYMKSIFYSRPAVIAVFEPWRDIIE